MLVPAFLVDGIKIGLESFSPKKYINGREDISKVSVIVPSYNGEKVIGRTLDDLVTRFPLDLIIICSNGSKDGTCQLARDYGVRLLEIPEAIGKVEAINRALFMVKTPYVVILDDDTLIGDAIIPTSILDDGQAGDAFSAFSVKKSFCALLQGHVYRKRMNVGQRFRKHSSTVTNISRGIRLFQPF